MSEPTDFREDRDDWAIWAAVYKAGRDDAMEALAHERRRSSEYLRLLGNIHQQTAKFATFATPEVSPSTEGECVHCGKAITFRARIRSGHWLTDARNYSSWKCPAPGLPVRSHQPK